MFNRLKGGESVDLIHCTEKMEFVDKLAKTLYTNTQSVIGIKIMVDSFIKVFGRTTDVDKDIKECKCKLFVRPRRFQRVSRLE